MASLFLDSAYVYMLGCPDFVMIDAIRPDDVNINLFKLQVGQAIDPTYKPINALDVYLYGS